MGIAEAIADRPTTHPPDPEDRLRLFPEELLRERRWLVWRYETRERKRTKVPVDPSTGRACDATNSSKWMSCAEALDAADRHGLDGIGFALGDGFVGIDLDDCRDAESGEIAAWARAIIERLDSYAEVSVSGTGVHVLLHGTMPQGSRHKVELGGGHLEAYDGAHYFTFSGRHLAGAPHTVNERPDELAALCKEHLAPAPAAPRTDAPPAPTNLADEEVLQLAFGAANGATVEALWRGEDLGLPSRSEADRALACHLAFYASDPAQVERLLLRSGRVREKWEARPAWLTALCEGACERVTERYSGELPAQGADLVRIPRALLTPDLKGGALLLAGLVVAGVPEGELLTALGEVSDETLRRWRREVREAVPEDLLRTRPSRRFVLVPVAMLADPALPRAARVTGLHLAAYMTGGRAKVGQATLAKKIRRERSRVTEDLATLVQAGHLCKSEPALFCAGLGYRPGVCEYWWPHVDAETAREGTTEAREGEGAGAVNRSTSAQDPANGHQEHVYQGTYAGGKKLLLPYRNLYRQMPYAVGPPGKVPEDPAAREEERAYFAAFQALLRIGCSSPFELLRRHGPEKVLNVFGPEAQEEVR